MHQSTLEQRYTMNYTITIDGQKWLISAGTLCQAIAMASAIKEGLA